MVFLDAKLVPQEEETLGMAPRLLFTPDNSMLYVLYQHRQRTALTSYVGMIDLKGRRYVGAVPLPEDAGPMPSSRCWERLSGRWPGAPVTAFVGAAKCAATRISSSRVTVQEANYISRLLPGGGVSCKNPGGLLK
jgi:hypothetical protein